MLNLVTQMLQPNADLGEVESSALIDIKRLEEQRGVAAHGIGGAIDS